MMRGLVTAALAAGLCCSAKAADATGVVTILEGDAVVYRGAGRLHAAEGLRLAPGDIIETGASTFAQVELGEQAVVQFGPSTRAWLGAAAGAKQKPERWLYVMEGWTKVTGGKTQAAAYELRTRPFWMSSPSGSVVVFKVVPAETALFVERGETRLAEHQAGGAPVAVALKQGDYYLRKPGARGAVNPGGMQGFVSDMPRGFRDSLPLRLDRFRDVDFKPKDAPAFGYADVEVWLKADPWIRRPLMQRWRAKAREPAFRAALIENLSFHPEWDPILFPEKYLPKDKDKEKEPRRAAPAAQGAASTAAASSPTR
jgi:hypothetical protein